MPSGASAHGENLLMQRARARLLYLLMYILFIHFFNDGGIYRRKKKKEENIRIPLHCICMLYSFEFFFKRDYNRDVVYIYISGYKRFHWLNEKRVIERLKVAAK